MDVRSQIINGIEDEYDPLTPNNFDAFHHALQTDHQIRILTKQQQRRNKERSEAKQGFKTPQAFKTPAANQNENVAYKIMNKYGFKEGQGLGKAEQGITQALSVQKTGRTVGKIINEDLAQDQLFKTPKSLQTAVNPTEMQQQQDTSPAAKPKTEYSNADLLKNSTKVILLQNMVDPSEVDEMLEVEIRAECEKYGPVLSTKIYCVIFLCTKFIA